MALTFTLPSKSSKFNMFYCGIASVIVVSLILILLNVCKFKFNPIKGISGLKSAISSSDAYLSEILKESNILNLTECKSDDESCNNYKEGVNEDKKKSHGEQIRKYVKENDEFLMFIYAPWCGHCHNALPKFNEASKKSSVKFTCVNAELVDSNLLQKHESSIVEVPYFPFICKKENNKLVPFEGEPTEESILEFSKTNSNDKLQMMFS